MAKTQPKKVTPAAAPAGGGSRRAQLASFEAARRSEQRRRTLGLLAICLVLALGLLAYPVILFVQDYRDSTAVLADVGVPAADAGCDAPAENAATGNQDHVAVGTKVPYPQLPPDSGPHYDTPAPFTTRFYTPEDRPAVETLVHNLEHGYTLAWYRADAPEDEIRALRRASRTFHSEEYDQTQKFIAAPWRADDGAFPEGKNVVLSRWLADPNNPADTAAQRGVRQACVRVSGAAIADFMTKYPSSSAPEPNGA